MARRCVVVRRRIVGDSPPVLCCRVLKIGVLPILASLAAFGGLGLGNELEVDRVNFGAPTRGVFQINLRVEREADSVVGALEGYHETIANSLHLVAIIAPQCLAENLVVVLNGLGHGLRGARPQRRRALNIGENNGKRLRGVFGGRAIVAAKEEDVDDDSADNEANNGDRAAGRDARNRRVGEERRGGLGRGDVGAVGDAARRHRVGVLAGAVRVGALLAVLEAVDPHRSRSFGALALPIASICTNLLRSARRVSKRAVGTCAGGDGGARRIQHFSSACDEIALDGLREGLGEFEGDGGGEDARVVVELRQRRGEALVAAGGGDPPLGGQTAKDNVRKS